MTKQLVLSQHEDSELRNLVRLAADAAEGQKLLDLIAEIDALRDALEYALELLGVDEPTLGE